MGGQIELNCRCGTVRAVVTDVSSHTVNRVVCYCDDCQAFAHRLGRADLLNEKGGSDVVQIAPSTLSFVQGEQRIAGMRLSPKGLYRWYASCCNTPLGNTLSPSVPFVGVVAHAFKGGPSSVDELAGRPIGAILGKYAVGEPPAGSTGLNISLLLRAIGKVIAWKLSGKTWPHPFFRRDTREPLYPITVLSREQREALRPLCGPRSAAQPAD